MDYLGAQRLLGYVLGQHQRPVAANVAQPTQAELTAQADWDKIDLQVKSMISVTVHLRVYRGVTWRMFHFSYTFHSYVLSILFHTSFRIQTPPTCPFHSTLSMLPFYSVHTQVYETCFTYLLFHLYLFQTFQYLNRSSRVVSSLVYTL
jgi:hypothetical protein